jgi:hypothetical protein
MKLQQNQLWKLGNDYILIVRLERLAVHYKAFQDILLRHGIHQDVTKKQFCRLIKPATLISPEEVKILMAAAVAAASPAAIINPTTV